MKQQRWYEIVEDTLYIYDRGFRKDSKSVTITSVENLPYYKKTFRLRKIWGDEYEFR